MKNISLVLALLMATKCFSQTDWKLSTFLSFQVNKTLYDRTITNNSSGIGFGLQTHLNTKTWVKPTLEINADLFGGTKELYVTTNDQPIDAKSGVASIYIGPMLQLPSRLFVSTTFGTSIYNSEFHFGIRPSVGFYPSKSKRWTAKVSFTNIFQQDDISKKSFGYANFALAFKIF